MIQAIYVIQILALIFLCSEKIFEGRLKTFTRIFVGISFLIVILSRISHLFKVIPPVYISACVCLYMILTILFLITCVIMIFKRNCPTKKEKLKVLSTIVYFFLHLIALCSFLVLPPLFFNYLVLWITGCFNLLKTVKFWIFVLLEVFVYGIMLGFNLDLSIILLWCLVCEIYLLFWIYNMPNKPGKKKKVKND